MCIQSFRAALLFILVNPVTILSSASVIAVSATELPALDVIE